MKPLYSIVLAIRSSSRNKKDKASAFSGKDMRTIERIVRTEKGFDGFSMAKLTGFWMGSVEECVEIRILSGRARKVKDCAQKLRRAFKQDSVLLTRQGTGTFVS
jgi:hypothetical protein